MNKLRLLVQVIVVVSILTSCDSCGDNGVYPPQYQLTISGKSVTVVNDNNYDLAGMGVIAKIQRGLTNTTSPNFVTGLTIHIGNGYGNSSQVVGIKGVGINVDYILNNWASATDQQLGSAMNSILSSVQLSKVIAPAHGLTAMAGINNVCSCVART